MGTSVSRMRTDAIGAAKFFGTIIAIVCGLILSLKIEKDWEADQKARSDALDSVTEIDASEYGAIATMRRMAFGYKHAGAHGGPAASHLVDVIDAAYADKKITVSEHYDILRAQEALRAAQHEDLSSDAKAELDAPPRANLEGMPLSKPQTPYQ
jgi:hypothetical protein